MTERGQDYTCAVCRGTFTAAWSEEEARAELGERFPGAEVGECALVCDDCYQRMDIPQQSPAEVAASRDAWKAQQALSRLVRDDRRRRLRAAIEGESGRWAYCLGRVTVRFQTEFILWGHAEYDPQAGARQAVRHYHRLTRLAARWASKRSDP